MYFKNWLKLFEQNMFLLRDKTQKLDLGKILGFKKPLVKFSQGSIATIYEHPNTKDLLIKVTSHKDDIKNIITAQKLKSDNVVKVFSWQTGELVKQIPQINSYAIIVEKILGNSMSYTTNEFFELSLDGRFELAADWLDGNLHKRQIAVLEHNQKNNLKEHSKLNSLFRVLNKLESLYRIELSDFQDNIIDSGDRYVIVDMGF
jgi:hypothetical protein